MGNEKKKLPHITLNPDNSTRTRRVGRAVSSPLYEPIKTADFSNKLNRMIETYSVKLLSSERTYFLIDLTLPYYNSEVRALIKRLKLDLKSVLSDFKILVATEKENLKKYLETGKIHKSTLRVIKDINQLESSYKIGESLQKIIKRDVARIKAIPVYIQLIGMDSEERQKCIEYLKDALYSEKSIYYYENSGSISCICSTSKVKKVAKIPFVELITESPRPQIFDYENELLIPAEQIKFTEDVSNSTPICILDTGVSDFLDPFVIERENLFPSFNSEDEKGHGTSVASVALFGEQLLERKTILSPETNIISFKIDDEGFPEDKINLEEAVKKAVKKFKKITPIFNLSYNYDEEMPIELRKKITNNIDKFIQKENVLLVNSAGNISLDRAFILRDEYPRYLSHLNVLCPSEGRNILSVGSICLNSTDSNIIYSRHTRIGIPPHLQTEEIDKHEFFKPEIHTYGGNSEPNDLHNVNIITSNLCFPVLDNKMNLTMSLGTSFSAPLISLCLARIHTTFKAKLKNCETIKAVLLNQCFKNDCNGITTFSLKDTKNVGYCSDGVYLNFEGQSKPHEKSEEKKASKIIKCKKIKFYVPEGAKDIDAVIVHSNNYENQSVEKMNTKIILKLVKPSGTICKKSYGNIGRKSAVTYANYSFSREYEGEWEAELHIETAGIPSELFDRIDVRYGVSLRINFKDDVTISEAYNQVLEKSPSVLKSREKIPLEVVRQMPQMNADSQRESNIPTEIGQLVN
jgi:hypothetical protein